MPLVHIYGAFDLQNLQLREEGLRRPLVQPVRGYPVPLERRESENTQRAERGERRELVAAAEGDDGVSDSEMLKMESGIALEF